jgi:alkylation response protein AidB-like acyl-CoA dehydrogenase
VEFDWTDQHRAFRRRLRDVLARELPADWPEQSGYDNGSEYSVAFSRRFCPTLAAEGLLIPHWPKVDGGEGLDAFHHWILGEEMWSNGEPRGYQYMSVNWVGPAILRYGTEEQKETHIPRICGGTVSYCQGFSEPEAGSDLAALKTRAIETDRGFAITGQKIWTSAASFADYCILLARTGPEEKAPISVFIVPMGTPGITVRRIPSLQGLRAMHEVFLDEVEVEANAVLGPLNDGWSITRHVLANERIGAPRYALTWKGLNRALEHMRQDGRLKGETVRLEAARCEAAIRSARLMSLQVIDRRVKGLEVDAGVNAARYAMVMADRLVAEFLGANCPDLLFPDADPIIAAAFRRSSSMGIAAGAAEIQLNLIAQHVLQLPRGKR